MTIARFVFIGAGVWGIGVLAPLFFLVDATGRVYTPPADYPHFFYGFLAVALVWQLAFLLIATDPVRFRPLMTVAVLEKAGYVLTAAVLYGQARISASDASTAVPDAVLMALFIVAYVRTRPAGGQVGGC